MSELVPKIKFSEFSHKWKHYKLCELSEIRSASRVHKEQWTESGVPFFRTSDVVSAYKGKENNKAFISIDLFKELSNKSGQIKKNDLLVTGGGSIGVPYLVPNDEPLYFKDADLLWFKNKAIVNEFYLYTFFLTPQFRSHLRRISHTGTISHYTIEQAKSTPINLPSLIEQQKIASFLMSVDSKISQLTEKHRLLKEYKKGVMQQIFSQQLRFKDEDGKAFPGWKDQLLADIADFSKGKGISKSDISISGKTRCIRYGELYTTYGEVIEAIISATNIPKSELILSQANDVIVPSSGETQWDIATAACVKVSGVAYSGDLTVIRSQLNGVFLSYYLNSAKKRDIAALSQGSSVIHLYSSHMKFLKIKTPCLEEQQKIAQFLQSIDKKIDAVEQQVEQTKQFKKGLLQQMFV